MVIRTGGAEAGTKVTKGLFSTVRDRTSAQTACLSS